MLDDAWQDIIASTKVDMSLLMTTYIDLIDQKMYQNCGRLFCPSECDSVQYNLAASVSKFSIDSMINYVFFNKSSLNKPIENYSLDEFVYFKVYFNELSYTAVSQIAKTKALEFFSNIGGIIGLFVGVTFLSLIEILEVIVGIIFICLNK